MNYKTEPYFNDFRIRLYLNNTIDQLKLFPDKSIDLIFADPPYNLSNDGFTCYAGKRVSVNKGKWDKSNGIDEDFNFHFNWINECRRILKDDGTIWISGTYHSIYSCGFALQRQGWHLLNDITWFKPNAAPNLSTRMFTASHETLLWAKKDKNSKHKFNYDFLKNNLWKEDIFKNEGKQMRSVWAITSPKNEEKVFGKHPTQKPLALLERIILAASFENDIILDPFCGSGTTGVAALKYNRKFIGIDIESEYLDNLAIPRLNQMLNDNKLTFNHQVRDNDFEYNIFP